MKYRKLVENASKPDGFWGKLMIRAMNKGHSELTDWALGFVLIRRSDTVLDVGCGGGKTVSKLCKAVGNGKVFGVDYSDLCVDKSRKLNSKEILCGKVRILRASVSDLPFENDSLDLVTAVETYYFWQDKQNDLKEILRILKPGGKILLVFEMLKTDDDPFKWEKVENLLKINAVSENEISQALKSAGYTNIKTYTKGKADSLCAVAQKPKL